MQKNLIIILLFSILIAIFAILNAVVVPINLIFTKVDISISLVILISACIGAVITYALDTISKIKKKKKIKELENMLAKSNDEIKVLKEKEAQLVVEMEKLSTAKAKEAEHSPAEE